MLFLVQVRISIIPRISRHRSPFTATPAFLELTRYPGMHKAVECLQRKKKTFRTCALKGLLLILFHSVSYRALAIAMEAMFEILLLTSRSKISSAFST